VQSIGTFVSLASCRRAGASELHPLGTVIGARTPSTTGVGAATSTAVAVSMAGAALTAAASTVVAASVGQWNTGLEIA